MPAILAEVAGIASQFVCNQTSLAAPFGWRGAPKDFLQRDNVGVERPQNFCNAFRQYAAIQSTTLVYVISNDANRSVHLPDCLMLDQVSWSDKVSSRAKLACLRHFKAALGIGVSYSEMQVITREGVTGPCTR